VNKEERRKLTELDNHINVMNKETYLAEKSFNEFMRKRKETEKSE